MPPGVAGSGGLPSAHAPPHPTPKADAGAAANEVRMADKTRRRIRRLIPRLLEVPIAALASGQNPGGLKTNASARDQGRQRKFHGRLLEDVGREHYLRRICTSPLGSRSDVSCLLSRTAA
jgi:hypothetical protein